MNIDLIGLNTKYEKYHREKVLINIDKFRCLNHQKWAVINNDELSKLPNPKYKWSYMLFKNMHGKFSEFFVPDAVYQTKLLPQLNPHDFISGIIPTTQSDFADKNYQELLASNISFPETIVREINGFLYDKDFNLISADEAVNILKPYDNLVIKDSNGVGHGKGVDCLPISEIEIVIKKRERHNYVVQKVLKQSKDLEKYNESSVNIVRMTSLLWHNKVYVLGGILRVGAPGSFCDHLSCHGTSPLVVPLTEEGLLINKALDCDTFVVHDTLFGKEISGCIPNYEIMKKSAVMAHQKLAFHRLIGWDFTLDQKNNVVCMEYNTFLPGIVQSQCALGPFFNIYDDAGHSFLKEMLGWEA